MHSLTSALDGGGWSASRPSSFTPRERAPGTRWIGGRVGHRAVLVAVAPTYDVRMLSAVADQIRIATG
jgi:hypothetical protein